MTSLQSVKSVRLILASGSPRRKELLGGLELPFEVMTPGIDESVRLLEAPASYALRMAFEKAMAVVGGVSGDEPLCVIAADTIVVLGDCILGKPRDAADASRMLHMLSGNTHNVITGMCVFIRDHAGERVRGDAVHTRVVFRHVTEAEIHHYVASGEPMDKAGAYAIQGGAAGMVDHIEGSYSNVVGLPMENLTRTIGAAGLL
jgi:septum formation protein